MIRALRTNFQGTLLTGICIEDWNINSETNFNKANCDYVYLKTNYDEQNEKTIFEERRPSDPQRNFEPGEFAKLVQKSIETVDLIFNNGIDWKAFLTSFEKLQIECGSDELSIHSIENKGGGAFVIRVNVPTGADKAEIEKYLRKIYKLEAQVEAKSEQLANLMEITKLLASKPAQNIIDVTSTAESKSMSETNKSKYDLSNANVGGIVDTAQSGSHQEFTQHNYASEQKQTLVEAAEEIQKLLKQLESSNPTATVEQQQAYIDIAIPKPLKERLISALKAMSDTAIEEFLQRPGVKVVASGVKAWMLPD